MQKIFLPICILLLCSTALAQTARAADTTKLSCGPAAEVALRNLTVNDSSKLPPSDKEKILKDIKKRSYQCDSLGEISERLRQAYQEHGYFKTIIEEPVFTVIKQTGSSYLFDVAMTAKEGQQYKLKDIAFTGTTVFSSEALRPEFPIAAGDIFDVSKIRTGLDHLHNLYAARGYVDFTPVPDTKIDDHDSTISLTIDISEGASFRYGELIVDGEESQPGGREELLKTWEVYQGRPYDNGMALRSFLRDIHARMEVKPEEIFETSKDEKLHVINVHLHLLNPPGNLSKNRRDR